MRKILIPLIALLFVATACHKDNVEPRHMTVIYHGNGGQTSSGETSVKDVQLGRYQVISNCFTNGDKVFDKWNTSADGSGWSYRPGNYIRGDNELYAQWLKKYHITFHANGGSGYMNPQDVTQGNSVTLNANTFTRDGYVFVKWNTQRDGSGTSYNNQAYISPTSDLTLYAQWRTDDGRIYMCTGSTNIQTGRTYYFYDSGGPNSYYSNNENYTFTFYAPSGKRVKIVFNSFSTESGYDYLTISGSTYSGTNSPGTKYSSYGGSITVSWHSDGSYIYSGWSATVTAVD